jgi:hypothetical protein
MRNAIWNVGRKLMVGTALMVGLLGTGAVAANAQAREFRGGHEYGRGYERPAYRGNERGYDRGYGYRPGFGLAVEAPYADAYIPPCPGEGYVWLGGAWVFRGGYRGGYGYGQVARFDHDRAFGERGFGRGDDRGHGDGRRVDGGRGFDRGGERGRR